MAYRNVFDVPGFEVLEVVPSYSGGNPIAAVVDGEFVFTNAGGLEATFYRVDFGVESNIADLVVTPCNFRVTATYSLVEPGDGYFYVSFNGDTQPPNPEGAGNSGAYSAEAPSTGLGSVIVSGYDTSGAIQVVSVLFEVDSPDIVAEKWTNFKECVEVAD